jgi:excisionase family DNA binding protein
VRRTAAMKYFMNKKLMSKKEVAEIFSVSIRSIERLAARGELKKVKIGGCVRFRLKEIEAILQGEGKSNGISG